MNKRSSLGSISNEADTTNMISIKIKRLDMRVTGMSAGLAKSLAYDFARGLGSEIAKSHIELGKDKTIALKRIDLGSINEVGNQTTNDDLSKEMVSRFSKSFKQATERIQKS